MKKFEYCAIRASIDGKVKKLKFFSSTGEHSVTDIEDIHLEIAKLGNESWELVTLTQITSPDSRVYYFKRSL
ncbi:MAG: hypothetical protein ACXACX_03590 [Candidatus Hodarchaeales archaeon]